MIRLKNYIWQYIKTNPLMIVVVILLLSFSVASFLSNMKSHKTKIQLRMDIKDLHEERDQLHEENDLLQSANKNLTQINAQITEREQRWMHFADSMAAVLKRHRPGIVLIHSYEDDRIVGSLDLGGQLRAFTEFSAQTDSIPAR